MGSELVEGLPPSVLEEESGRFDAKSAENILRALVLVTCCGDFPSSNV